MKFYPIPICMQNSMQKIIFNYINFPQKVNTIAQEEMWKTPPRGGIKLINLKIKSQTSKAKWLIDIATNPDLKLNLDIFTTLMGTQKGHITGRDIIFLQKSYFQKLLKTECNFYKEALLSLSVLETKKGINNISCWDQEHIFYNPLFLMGNRTLSDTKNLEESGIYRYEQLLQEKDKEGKNLPHNKILTNMLNKIQINTSIRQDDVLITVQEEEIKMKQITQKLLYEETLFKISRDHHSQVKWVEKLNTPIEWELVWKTVHNFLSTNRTKTLIWQQIHLNFYTQYSYNKWHKKTERCPMCLTIPESIYHTMLHCDFTNNFWQEIEPLLKKLYPVAVTEEEKAFGIVQQKKTNGEKLDYIFTKGVYFPRRKGSLSICTKEAKL